MTPLFHDRVRAIIFDILTHNSYNEITEFLQLFFAIFHHFDHFLFQFYFCFAFLSTCQKLLMF